MCDETPQERQDNEIEALKAIFGDQIEDKRAAIAWKVWRPLDLLLTLHPLHSSSAPGVHCSVTLHVKCCEEYPNKPPKISIHKLHGLSNENGAKLIVELEELTRKLCGEVMIFEVAQHVQSFLHTFNKPTLSFYDEMLERRNELEKLKQHDREVKENEERLKMKSEIQRRQEILKAAPRRTHRTSISQEGSPPEDRGDAPHLVLYYSDHKVSATKKSQISRQSLPCNCTCKGIQILRLTQRNNKKVHVGKCIDHSSTGSTTYLAIDADTGELLITKKWTLNPATDFQTRNKQINAIEQDFKSMCKLKNQSLIPYTALEIQQEVVKRTTVQCVYLVREFVLGSSLKFLRTIGVGDSFDALRLLRHVAIGVFGALNELHSVGVVHRDVASENVFLDSDGKVKLVGAALDVRLMEIMDSESYCDSQTKGQDILAAACMLLLIISPKNQPNEIPSHLPSTARDFFSRCLTEDEHLQWSAEQLLNHCFLLDAPSVNPESKQQDDGYSGSEDEERELARSFVSHTLPTSGHSRLSAEFEVLKWLGKGAFGDVLKVKNKLDGGFYALKRIKLNPENVNLNKKITREVKLLSRLNHENVVRYYNAWIETIEANIEASGSSEISVVEKHLVTPSRPAKKLPPNSMEALAAKLAPGVKLEWSISESPIVKRDTNSDSDTSDDDDDEDDGWFKGLPKTTALDDETSSSIEFECENVDQSQALPSDEPDSSRAENERIQQVLYIQMEFCEKNTLRQAIDNGLFKESFRVWRLFREIVSGLNHVHQRGMIHRDLKPVNIFLDSNDHVKIGDFGLATKAFGAPQLLDDKAKVPEEFGGSLTGQVGTALYVAPELLQAGNKVIYNQKVDIYSLGIILFEMFHPPLDTGMERMKVLTELRSKDIVMPALFETEDNAKQIHLIRWLLTHEPSNRPTCTELLTSEHVPRPVQEGALSALISHTLTAKPNRSYQLLVNACMEQRTSPAEDYTYHSGLRTRPDAVVAALKEVLIEVFKIHGATEFSPPLLVPRAKIWDQYPNAVKVMTAFGSVCHLPHDLRLPFARHVAYTETKWLRRYVIERVFREKQVEGFHPREISECAFDIVTPKTGSLWPDAETLVVAAKAATEANLRVAITLNHTEILRIVLLCCGVPVDRHKDLYPILVDVRLGRITNLQLQTHLTSLCITNRDIANLLRLMDSEVAIAEVQDLLGPFTKKAEWSRTLRRAIADLVAVSEIAKGFGLECTVSVAPCLAYNATQHAGVFWQMAVLREYRKHRSGDVIAVGGRYDALVEEFWRVARTERDGTENLMSSSVGFSMSLERMANIIRKMDDELKSPAFTEQWSNIAVCICVPPSAVEAPGRAATWALGREAWGSGLRGGAALCDGSAAEARERTAATIVLADDGGAVRATHWDDNRVREHRIAFIDVADFLKQKLNPDSNKVNEGYNRLVSWSDSEKASGPNISVTFITSNDKMSKNSRRQCENQISTQLSSALSRLGVSCGYSRWRACVVAALCEGASLRALATVLGERAQLLHDVGEVYERFPKRRKILEEIISELQALASNSINQSRSSDDPVIFALYSIPDSMLKILI